MSARPPRMVWRLVPEDEFPLQGLLRLLFEPDREQDEGRTEGGADAVAS
jgi:hypothetical protein